MKYTKKKMLLLTHCTFKKEIINGKQENLSSPNKKG